MSHFGVQYDLNITLCDDAADAIKKGFNWSQADPRPKPIRIKQAVVVKKGTVEGNSTVDLLLEDQTGQEFVVMVTGSLLRAIPTYFNGPSSFTSGHPG